MSAPIFHQVHNTSHLSIGLLMFAFSPKTHASNKHSPQPLSKKYFEDIFGNEICSFVKWLIHCIRSEKMLKRLYMRGNQIAVASLFFPIGDL